MGIDHIYPVYVINVLYEIQLAITYTIYTTMVICGLHHVWTSHVGVHKQCMAKVAIFPRSSSTLREGGGAWPHVYLGNANCWFTVDIICQHLADYASTSRVSCTVSNWSTGQVTTRSPLAWLTAHVWRGVLLPTDRLCCNTIIRLWRCLPLATRRRHAVYTNATYRIPHADIQCAIDMIYIIIYIIMHGVSF